MSTNLLQRLLPAGVTDDAWMVVGARALRGFGDGFISIVLVIYLDGLGFSEFKIGVLVTATLLGSAALTLAVGLLPHRLSPRTVLLAAAGLMAATGLGFAGVTQFWPLLLVAFAGTLNPSAGDVSVFLPVEQAVLSGKVSDRERTALFARYNLGGTFAGALGALASGIPLALANANGWDVQPLYRAAFAGYAVLALVIAGLYVRVSAPSELAGGLRSGLGKSRRVVLQLSALFSVDSFGGGFVVQSLLVLWLFKRFDLSEATAAGVFFAAGLLSAFSQLMSSRLASRIGLVRTMVFTHLPANVFLVIAAFMPRADLAIAFLLLRMALSQMDVPARQSFVMQVVSPEERPAAASVTNVPRSLAAAVAPLLAGLLLAKSSFGWPLIVAGLLKIAYDLLLLRQFARLDGAPPDVPLPPARVST